ncbi:hypothetical protein [Pseudonocardia sp. McavD-2-B]|uniref:hypothetical protein n=1 Tax=Pseudonocardia sp. McavD-2-B TaxID=2954499 RepID=UPI002096D0B3|nr:hypothetical protein [Pseudonocardia sp. McavD-2-B]MCO7192301.1 hypothetical protein [Pseudonocardia sp. McavD-2-B]
MSAAQAEALAALDAAVPDVAQPPVCMRCNRDAEGWPVGGYDVCSPRSSRVCRRSPFVVAIENARAEGVPA